MSFKKVKPPDHRVIKTSLSSLLHPNFPIYRLNDAIGRVHKLNIIVTHFIRYFLLYKTSKGDKLPIVTEDFIKMAFKAISESTKTGRPPSSKNLLIYQELSLYYNQEFRSLLDPFFVNISSKNLSYILGYEITSILTTFENNIREHFYNHLHSFIRGYFKQTNENILNTLPDSLRRIRRKELLKELQELTDNLFSKSPVSLKFNDWTDSFKAKILPSCPNNLTYEEYLQVDPQEFLSHLIFMANILEKLNLKSFQIFPLRTTAIPKYIRLDTSCLVYLFLDSDAKYMKDIYNLRNDIWSKFFDLSNKAFKQKNHIFDYAIETDGCGASISFLEEKEAAKSEVRKQKMRLGRNTALKANKNISKEEKDAQLEAKDIKALELKTEKIIALSKAKKQNKENFKQLSAEEKNEKLEFPYLDKLSFDSLNKLKDERLVFIDPGKRVLFYMIDEEFDNKRQDKADHRLRYTNRRRMEETKRLIYQEELFKRRNKKGVSKLEESLSKHNKKTCDYLSFKDYIIEKFRILSLTYLEYQSLIYRKLHWYGYINEQRADQKLFKEIRDKFGKDPLLIMGDYSHNNRLKYISTPGLGLKRKLGKQFRMLQIDEFRTSKLDNRTEKECENLRIAIKSKNGKKTKNLHAVLTSKMENQRKVCMNRDLNSVLNMKKIANHYISTGERLEAYRRTPRATSVAPLTSSKVEIKEKIVVDIRLKDPSKETCRPKLSFKRPIQIITKTDTNHLRDNRLDVLIETSEIESLKLPNEQSKEKDRIPMESTVSNCDLPFSKSKTRTIQMGLNFRPILSRKY